MHRCRNPLFCVVPPYLLSHVAARGNERQRSWALRTLSADTTIRQARAVNTKARGRKGPREGYDALAAAAPAARNRVIWDAEHTWEVTGGRRVRDEHGKPTGDPAVDEAFDGLGETWDFWQDVFSRDSIDDENMPMRGVVHYGEEYPNAFWDGRRMVFGDGDGEIFARFTKSLDVIGHELGHGVIEDEAALEYHGQSGRAERARGGRRRDHGQAAQARSHRRRGGLADRRRPARRAVRGRRAALDEGARDGLRRPAARQGPAARPLARLRAHVRGQRRRAHQLGDPEPRLLPARQRPRRASRGRRPGRIWYDALRSPLLTPTATFRQFARITHRAARQRFGPGSDQAKAVRAAWAEVGIRWE